VNLMTGMAGQAPKTGWTATGFNNQQGGDTNINNQMRWNPNSGGLGGVDWAKQGFTGQTNLPGNSENPEVSNSVTPEFADWLSTSGYSPSRIQDQPGSTAGWNAVVDRNNNPVEGSQYYDNSNDKNFWTAANLAGGLVSGGVAANPVFGGLGSVGSGAVSGGVSGFLQDGTPQSALKGAAIGGAMGGISDYAKSSLSSAPTYPIDPATADPGYRNQMDISSDNYTAPAQSFPVTPPSNIISTPLSPEITAPPISNPVNAPPSSNAQNDLNPGGTPAQNPPPIQPIDLATNPNMSGLPSLDPTAGQAKLDPSGTFSPEVQKAITAGSLTGVAPNTSSGSLLSSIGDFAKANPGLTAGLAGGLASAVTGGNGGNAPSGPVGTSNGLSANTNATNQQTIDALSQKINKNSAIDPALPALKTNAGDPTSYYQTAADAAYDRQKQYLDPQVALQQKSLEARLSEQGFVPGTPGYAQAMQTFQDTNNRAYASARDSAIQQGVAAGQGIFTNNLSNANLNNSASNSTLDQYIRQQNQPVNTLNALQNGQQIQYNNNIDQYNANTASKNSLGQTLGQLGTAAAIYFSDARLKDDIAPIGRTAGGVNIYSYTIFGRKEIGVLAQELALVQPEAVSVDPASGFYVVDYSKVR
jgi:hypothetical protein